MMSESVNPEQAWDDEDDGHDDDLDEVDEGQMNEEEMRDLLANLLGGEQLEDVCDADVSVSSFSDSGVMTMNEGLVVRVGDAEFQVTIVRSR